jgi:hypothetical protein
MLSKNDLLLLQSKGITAERVQEQIEFFKQGFPFVKVVKAAEHLDGIEKFDNKEVEEYIAEYELKAPTKRIVKFVPASGAATRMFKSMFEQLERTPDAPLSSDVAQVVDQIKDFAFYDDLMEVMQKSGPSAILPSNHALLLAILSPEGLNYGNLPKGLLKFHNYPEGGRTSIEEHLVEGALYSRNADRSVHIHFTVSPEHQEHFEVLIRKVREAYEKQYKVQFEISFSIQKSSTDTIAVDSNNLPFRNLDGSLLFRPGGHGALIDNLNDLDADIIFIKNIDNVVPDHLKNETVRYKKVLGGLLLKLQERVFEYSRKLEEPKSRTAVFYAEVINFIETNLGYSFHKKALPIDIEELKDLLTDTLNRPIRVCGMVKNTGEPGGGPFWVENPDGSLSLQILEGSQFDKSDHKQKQILESATHFNPVDLVVTTHDFKGHKFDLTKYRDPKTGFISSKSKDGKELKALELPGLWNGAMAYWNTAFVEVPLLTFNPVKSINDLLRPEHQKN